MSAGSLSLYPAGKVNILSGEAALATSKIQVVLLTGSYSPQPSHATYADVSANEVSGASGTGYTTGGQALAGAAVAASGAGAVFTASANSWPAATFAAQYAVLVQMSGTALAATDKLIGYAELSVSGPLSVAGATFEVAWPTTGILLMP